MEQKPGSAEDRLAKLREALNEAEPRFRDMEVAAMQYDAASRLFADSAKRHEAAWQALEPHWDAIRVLVGLKRMAR